MLTITKGNLNIFTYRFDWFISQIALTALKYEILMFQEFRTQNRKHGYSKTVYVLFFKTYCFLPVFPVIAIQRYDSKTVS